MGKGEEEKEGATVRLVWSINLIQGRWADSTLSSIKGGCLNGLTKDMMKDALHIWTTTAVVEIPPGAKQYEDDGPDD
jgi:hypothetical protein